MTTTQPLTAEPEATPRRARWVGTTAAVLALAIVGVAARMLADFQWDRVVEYRSPYVFDLAPAAETPRLADRVILVVVDGLRVDTSEAMPGLQRLGEEGSALVARASQPSLSFPGWTNLVSGAPPQISGVTTNWYEGRVAVDSIPASARRAGLTTAVAGGAGWRQLFRGDWDHRFYVPDARRFADERIGDAALRILSEEDPDFLLVHLPDVDHRGHETGVDAVYRDAALGADTVIQRIAEAAGDAAMIVTSDHGHIEAGGHGGPEEEVILTPLALWGDGLVPGARGMVAQSDVAPTVAALLGIGRPAHATGTLRVELLDADEDTRAEISGTHEEAASLFYTEAARVVGGSGSTEAAFERALEERHRHDVIARLPIALGVVALLAIAVALASRGLDAVAILLGSAVFFATWAGIFLARGLTFSFSHFNTEDQVDAFLLARLVDTLIALAVAAVVAGLVAGRRQRAGAFQTGLGLAAWILLVAGMGVAAFLVVFGWGFAWGLPNLVAGFAQFLALLAMFGIGVAAWAAGLVAMGTAALVAPRRGR
ncbi:MAG TPA: alkaline phosphatase family protein [Actinomycetota bacterium]|nr:alkaline phosphatase family protein [Actinomycetota bacterium]